MQEIILKAKSSDGDFYSVSFKLKEGLLRLRCDCVAGKFGQLCKHKLELLNGELPALFDSSQLPELTQTQEWVRVSTYPKLLNRLAEAEARLNEQKRTIKALRKEMELATRQGA